MSGIPKGFTVRGGIEAPSQNPIAVRRAVEALEKVPFKELLTVRQLAALLGYKCGYFGNHTADPGLDGNRYQLAYNKVVYGSKRTIAELKKLNAESR